MSRSAPTPSRATSTTLEMKVANMTFMLERLAQDCAPLQFVRELTQNAIDSIIAQGGQGEIRWDVDWKRNDLEPGIFKLAIIDTGIGMTGPELIDYINQLSSSMHEQSKHGNFGMGAKIAAAPLNPHGLIYLSWKNGKGSMIHLWKDPDTGSYGLQRFPNSSEFWLPVQDCIKPEPIKDHGTMVVLLGKHVTDDTMDAPPGTQIPSRWILRYLNMRYFQFPQGITVKVRENWKQPRTDRHNMLRRVEGHAEFLTKNSESSGTVELSRGKAHWWILKDGAQSSGSHFDGGHVGALFNDELYEMSTGRPGVARLQSFGVIFGYNRVVIYIEPFNDGNGSLTANTARTNLLIDGQTLPWTDWAAGFREKMPDEISRLMDQVASGTGDSDNANAIRERLKQIRDLFRFTRYRPASDGKHMIDDDATNTGGRSDAGSTGSSSRSGNRSGGGGRAGDIYSLFAETGDTPAEEMEGLSDPIVRWVSIREGTRTPDFLEDRAAKYLPQVNTIQANADFRVFTDMIARWKKFYSQVPAAGPVVESVVREWFQQQLEETVLGALALRRSGANWSEQEAEMLWSEEALTSAVLPRYHVDQSIKRALGSKMGTLKDKDVA